MNLDNRRLTEIQKEKKLFKSLLDNADTISDCLTYKGKLDLLESEEKEILKRCDVIIWPQIKRKARKYMTNSVKYLEKSLPSMVH